MNKEYVVRLRHEHKKLKSSVEFLLNRKEMEYEDLLSQTHTLFLSINQYAIAEQEIQVLLSQFKVQAEDYKG